MRRFGKTAAGAQRFQCCICKRTFTWQQPESRRIHEQHWFLLWLEEGYSLRELCIQSGHLRRKLQRIIHEWLQRPPDVPTPLLRGAAHLVADGTFLERRTTCVFGVMDGVRHEIIAGAYGVHEFAPAHLRAFFGGLRARGLAPTSATVDGNPRLAEVLREIFPGITIQRCVVHVQRQGLMWCRRYPKRAAGKHLRALFLRVVRIGTYAERDAFLSDVLAWEARYGAALAKASEGGWVASDLKRARSMLLHALPYLFHYLDDPEIPRSTSMMEGYFSRMKELYRGHRGLARKHRSAYFRWHFVQNRF